MIEQWKQLKNHYEEVKKILQEQGCMDSMGRIRRWRGEVVFKALANAGHTSVGFDTCDCHG
jgi:hypothetical protein